MRWRPALRGWGGAPLLPMLQPRNGVLLMSCSPIAASGGSSKAFTYSKAVRCLWLPSISPTEHIRGLLCLLSIAVRALTLIRYTVSQSLQQADETLKGISPAYPHVKTNSPSAAMILAAFASITLAFVQHADQYFVHVSSLNHIQCRLLALLHLPADLYQRIADILTNHAPFFSEA